MCVMLVVWSGCEQDGDSGPKECSADWECNWPGFSPPECTYVGCLSGKCDLKMVSEGGACDDGDPMTVGDVCDDWGNCAGEPDPFLSGRSEEEDPEEDEPDNDPLPPWCECLGDEVCLDDGSCCAPNCGGNDCGDDGCGGSCGTCEGWQVCVSDECHGGNGAETCKQVEECLGDCVEGICVVECLDNGTEAAAISAVALGDCASSKCGGEEGLEQLDCVLETCGDEVQGCYGGQFNCSDMYDCLDWCAEGDGDCIDDCFASATAESQSIYVDMLLCGEESCGGLDGEEFGECFWPECVDLFSECVQGDNTCEEMVGCMSACEDWDDSETCVWECFKIMSNSFFASFVV